MELSNLLFWALKVIEFFFTNLNNIFKSKPSLNINNISIYILFNFRPSSTVLESTQLRKKFNICHSLNLFIFAVDNHCVLRAWKSLQITSWCQTPFFEITNYKGIWIYLWFSKNYFPAKKISKQLGVLLSIYSVRPWYTYASSYHVFKSFPSWWLSFNHISRFN